MGDNRGKLVYSVESYVPPPETPKERYARLESEAKRHRMTLEVLEGLWTEANASLVKCIAAMNRLLDD